MGIVATMCWATLFGDGFGGIDDRKDGHGRGEVSCDSGGEEVRDEIGEEEAVDFTEERAAPTGVRLRLAGFDRVAHRGIFAQQRFSSVRRGSASGSVDDLTTIADRVFDESTYEQFGAYFAGSRWSRAENSRAAILDALE
ncbi:hypothetical protein [Prauserella aidingensis]|uniref:hypothetical protein n=1 Tax=Prauserella aidingensis TaxID=387890 RepID=UPI0020A55608|nr:hypothetical protein [Prauserella aidingensis]